MQIKIQISAYNFPSIRIAVNGTVYFDSVLENPSTTIEFDADLDQSNSLTIEHYNKTNKDTLCDSHGKIISDKAAELTGISFDKYNIPRNILFKQPFNVQWPANLLDDAKLQGEPLPNSLYNNLYFGFNGTYCFDFTNNISKDYFYYFWQMERDANCNLQMVDESSNTGYFEAYGLKLEINKDFNYTIHDLKNIIDNQGIKS
jgi:hypothetical protein